MRIVANNAIPLIGETRCLLTTEDEPDLIACACVVNCAKSRFRPVIMTTATSSFGLLLLAISGGGMWSAMAYTTGSSTSKRDTR